jgi:transcriptional regulator with XRE-family HTH domain
VDLDEHFNRVDLVETLDPEAGRIFRGGGVPNLPTLEELDQLIGHALRMVRKRRGLSRADMGTLIGLSEQVYGRYERATSVMTVRRLIHLAEVLKMSPLEILFSAAPYLWGPMEERDSRQRLMRHVEQLPASKVKVLLDLVEAFERAEPLETAKDMGPKQS